MEPNKKTYLRDGRAPLPKNEVISRVMSANKSKNTAPEKLLRKELWRENLRGFRLHYKNIPGRPDIVFTKNKLAVFVNGCFWHRCPNCQLPLPKSNSDFWEEKFEKNTIRDKMKIDLLKKEGWEVIVIWECQIKENINKSILEIKKIISR